MKVKETMLEIKKCQWLSFLWLPLIISSIVQAQDVVPVMWHSQLEQTTQAPSWIVPVGSSFVGVSENPYQFFVSNADTLLIPETQIVGKIVQAIAFDSVSALLSGELRTRNFSVGPGYLETGNLIRFYENGTREFFDTNQVGSITNVVVWNQVPVVIRLVERRSRVQLWDAQQKQWNTIGLPEIFSPEKLFVLENKLYLLANRNYVLHVFSFNGTSFELITTTTEVSGTVKQVVVVQNHVIILGDFLVQDSNFNHQLLRFSGTSFSTLSEPAGKITGIASRSTDLVAFGIFEQGNRLGFTSDLSSWKYDEELKEVTISVIAEHSDSTLLVVASSESVLAKEVVQVFQWSPKLKSPVAIELPNQTDFLLLENSLVSDGTHFAVLSNSFKRNYESSITIFDTNANQTQSFSINPIKVFRDWSSNSSIVAGHGTIILIGRSPYDFDYQGQAYIIQRERESLMPWYQPYISQKKGLHLSGRPVLGLNGKRSFTLKDNSKDNIVIEQNQELTFISGFDERFQGGTDYFKTEFRMNEQLWKQDALYLWTNSLRRFEKKELSPGLAALINGKMELFPIPSSFQTNDSFFRFSDTFAEVYPWVGDEIFLRIRPNDFEFSSSSYFLFNVKTKTYREFPFSASAEQLYVEVKQDIAYLWGVNLRFNGLEANIFVSNGTEIKPLAIELFDSRSALFAVADNGTFAVHPVLGYPNSILLGTINPQTAFSSSSQEEIEFVETDPKPIISVQVFPNPFNPVSTMNIELKENQHISVHVFDVTGRKMATLFNGEAKAGLLQLPISAQQWSSGVYVYQVKSETQVTTGKLMIIK